METRIIEVSTEIDPRMDLPYVKQVFRLRRIRTDLCGRGRSEEVVYGATSLAPEEAGPRRLLKLIRGHWEIENRLHWVRDVTFDEDRSQVRTGAAPRAMATLRNLAISLFRLNGETNTASARRRFAWNPRLALALVAP